MYSSKGYTLIEVIVATAIFSAMVLLATFALDQGLRQYQGLMQRGVNFWDNARHLWVHKSLSSALDYYVRDRSGKWFPYFKGTADRVSYVSIVPFAGDIPVVIWIIKERQEDGRYALVYYELPVYTKTYSDIEDDYALGGYKKGLSIRLFEGLEDVEMEYFGYDIQRQREGWFNTFNGGKENALPLLVKFRCKIDGHGHNLIYAINTNSTRKVLYNEIYR